MRRLPDTGELKRSALKPIGQPYEATAVDTNRDQIIHATVEPANEQEIALPRGLLEAVALFEDCEELVEIFGKRFVGTYRAIKQAEYETFMEVISPWEREYLLLNV